MRLTVLHLSIRRQNAFTIISEMFTKAFSFRIGSTPRIYKLHGQDMDAFFEVVKRDTEKVLLKDLTQRSFWQKLTCEPRHKWYFTKGIDICHLEKGTIFTPLGYGLNQEIKMVSIALK